MLQAESFKCDLVDRLVGQGAAIFQPPNLCLQGFILQVLPLY
jgi:hypothetical protein